MTLPAKLQSYLACGTPILAAAGGESARVIKEAGCGFVCEQDADKLAELIKNEVLAVNDFSPMKQKAKKYFDDNFTIDLVIGDLEKMMGEE